MNEEIKVSELPEAQSVGENDLIMIVQGGINKFAKAKKVGTGTGGVTGDTLPIGSILPFAGSTIPENWLECKGQAVSRTDYAELFNAIGTVWGSGDGSTTFNLPDLQGKVTVGKDEDDTDFNEVGKTGGEKEHTLTIDEMPAHNHEFNKTNVATMASSGANEISQTEGGRTYELMGIKNTGGSQPHNNLQPYAVSPYIIKAKQSSGLVADVVDSLTSDSTTDALSAKQGKVLNEKIENILPDITVGQEFETGMKIAGKKEYGKIINFGALTNAINKEVAHGLDINNIEHLRIYGTTKDPTAKTIFPLPSVGLNHSDGIRILIQNDKLIINALSDRLAYTETFVYLYYTKK